MDYDSCKERERKKNRASERARERESEREREREKESVGERERAVVGVPLLPPPEESLALRIHPPTRVIQSRQVFRLNTRGLDDIHLGFVEIPVIFTFFSSKPTVMHC